MIPSARTRVVVADDHPLFRDGLVRRIKERPELELVGEAGGGPEALAEIRRLQPDVAVIDVKLPDLDGIAIAAAVARDELSTRVIMLSAFQDSALVYKALAAGARAYLSKDADRQDVCDTIVSVARGKVVVPSELQAGLADQIRVRSEVDRQHLTPREREVLRLIASGASAPQIGQRLHLSTGTVKTHLLHLYEKLGVSDRAAAVAEGMRSGLIE
jgi:two-component system, NarL family, nitrate/nitrite response regulator NarL